MLTEVVRCRQVTDDRFRRWFSGDSIDLFVWYEDGEIYGFQICYDKNRSEHALSWRRDLGWTHKSVDDGHRPGGFDCTPVLQREDVAPITRIIEEFEVAAEAIDPAVLDYIAGKLPEAREHLS